MDFRPDLWRGDPLPDDPAHLSQNGEGHDPVAALHHGQNLAALAQIYLRHANAPRAMVLGLAAMTMGDLRPQTVLLVADALLRAGDPQQALTVLDRFDDPEAQLTDAPNPAQIAARHFLTAQALFRDGQSDAARVALLTALDLTPATRHPTEEG